MDTDNEIDQEQEIAGARSREDVGGRFMGAVRRHPVLTLIGAAGVGLFGGVELAAGVLLGAGVAAMLRPRIARSVTARVRDRVPSEIKERVKAVVDAARGKTSESAGAGLPQEHPEP